MTPLDSIRAEVQRVLACATEAHDKPVAETLAWVMSLIDRERNLEALPPTDATEYTADRP